MTLYPEWRAEIETFDRRWHDMIPGVIPDTVAILDDLKRAGVRLFAITNFSSAKYRETFERFAFFRDFEGIVVSGDEQLLKPDAPIFQRLAERHALRLADCVFVDDNAANVAGAEAVGMTAVRFTEPEALRAHLRTLGFLV